MSGTTTKGKTNALNKEINYVHRQIIHTANIRKEKNYETKNFKYDYTLSPYTCKFNLFSLSYN